jgi:hypothetical protein
MRLFVNNLKEVGEGRFFLLAKESTYMGEKRADYVRK